MLLLSSFYGFKIWTDCYVNASYISTYAVFSKFLMSSGKINRTEAVQICKSFDIDTLIISQMRKQCHGIHVPEGSIPLF